MNIPITCSECGKTDSQPITYFHTVPSPLQRCTDCQRKQMRKMLKPFTDALNKDRQKDEQDN